MYKQENISDLKLQIEEKKQQILAAQKEFNQSQDLEQLKDDVVLFLEKFVSICKNINNELYTSLKRYFNVTDRKKEKKFFVKFATGGSFEIPDCDVVSFHSVIAGKFLPLVKKEIKKNKVFKKEPQGFKAMIEDLCLKIEKFSEDYLKKEKECRDEVAKLKNEITELENERLRLEEEKARYFESIPSTFGSGNFVKNANSKEKNEESNNLCSVEDNRSFNMCESQIRGAKKKIRKKRSVTKQVNDTTTEEEELFRDFSRHKEEFLQNPYLILNLHEKMKDLYRIFFLNHQKLLYEEPKVLIKLLSKNQELVEQYNFPILEILHNVFDENTDKKNEVRLLVEQEDKKTGNNMEKNLIYCQLYENVQFFVYDLIYRFRSKIGKDNFFDKFNKVDIEKFLEQEVFKKIELENFKNSAGKYKDPKDAFSLSISDLKKDKRKATKIFKEQRNSVIKEVKDKLITLILNVNEILLLLKEFSNDRNFTSDDMLNLISKNDSYFLKEPEKFLALIVVSRNRELTEVSVDKALEILSEKDKSLNKEKFLEESGINEDLKFNALVFSKVEYLLEFFYDKIISNFEKRIKTLANEIIESTSRGKFELSVIHTIIEREIFNKINSDNLLVEHSSDVEKLSEDSKRWLPNLIIECRNEMIKRRKEFVDLLLKECDKVQEEEKLDNSSGFEVSFPIIVDHNVNNEFPSNEITFSNIESCNFSSKFLG